MVDEETAAAWKKAIIAVPVVRGRRKVKIERADGTVDERDAADVVAALVERQGLEAAVREGALPIEIQRRRAAGLPDLCATCGKALGMSRRVVQMRTPDPSSWACASCSARAAHARLTPEQRSEKSRKSYASKTPEQRSELARKGGASKTPEQRSELARKCRKALAALTPEQRSEISRKSYAALTPEQRSNLARKGNSASRRSQAS